MEINRVKTWEDLRKCFEVRKKVFVDEQQVPENVELDEYDRDPKACHHVLASLGGRPLATGRWRFYDKETAKMQRVAVLRESRGTGVGRQLMLVMEAEAKEEGASYAVLDAQCHAEEFYRKLGYATVSGEPFLDAGIPHVKMRKKL